MENNRLNSEHLRFLVQATPGGMILVNSYGEIEFVNSQVEKIFGYKNDELVGQSIDILVPDKVRSSHPAYRKDFHKKPETRPMGAGRDLYGQRKDGSLVPLEIGLNPILLEDDQYVLASVVDITERKKISAQMAQLASIVDS